MKPFLHLLFLCSIVSLQAQSLPDNLQSQLDQITSDTAKINWLIAESRASLNSNLEEAYILVTKANHLAAQVKENTFIGNAAIQMTRVQLYRSSFDSLFFYGRKAYQAFQKVGLKKEEAFSYLLISDGYVQTEERDSALNYTFKALDIYEVMEDKIGIAQCYESICGIYRFSGDLEKGKEYGKKAVATLEEVEPSSQLASSYVTLAYLYFSTDEAEIALEYAKKAKAIEEQLPSTGPLHLASVDNLLGNANKYLGNYDLALEYYNTNLERARKVGEKRLEAVSLGNIGNTYLRAKEYRKAVKFISQSIVFDETKGRRYDLGPSYQELSEAYVGLGDYKNAYQFLDSSMTLYANFLEDQIANLESELEVKYDTEKKEETITAQEDTIKQQRLVQYLVIGIASLLALILFLLYRNYQDKQKSNAHLSKLNDNLAKKNDENELLLKEIHHRVKNNLQVISSLLSLQSANIKDPKVLDAVKESQNRVKSMGLIHQKLYQGENLASIEMKDYLHTLGESMIDSFGQHAQNITIQSEMLELELDVDTAIPIGLIVNELITNAIKYAFPEGQKGQINISLGIDEEKLLKLVVEDNGVGLQEDNDSRVGAGTGFGSQLVNLLTMQLNGKMQQESDNGMRTIIRFKQYKAA